MKKISVIILTVLVFVMSMSFSFASETENGGIPDGVIAVSDAEGLAKISENLSADYVITADITFDENSTWKPIGTPENPFTGTIDGGDYIISGLKVTITDDSEGDICAGLFGVTSGATIKNIRMKATRISVTESEDSSDWSAIYAGAVVGYAYDTKITNCFNTGNILTSSSKSMCVSGGIAGCADNGSSVTTSFNSGKVFSSSKNNLSLSGGICGELKSSSVTNCYNSGTVSSTAIKESFAYAGGIAGEASADGVDEKEIVNTDLSSILTSYNSGNITALKHSDATDNIDGNEGKFSAYGILASSLHSKVENCYSIDSVSACVGYSVSETEQETTQTEETAVNKILTSDKMNDLNNFTGFSEEVWKTGEGESYPYPTLKALPHDSVAVLQLEVIESPTEIRCTSEPGIVEFVGGSLLVLYDDCESEVIDFLDANIITEEIGYQEQTSIVCYREGTTTFVSPIIHDIEISITPGSCTENEISYGTCSVCGFKYEDITAEAGGHKYEYSFHEAEARVVKTCGEPECGLVQNATDEETINYIDMIVVELSNNYSYKDRVILDKIRLIFNLATMDGKDFASSLLNKEVYELLDARFKLYSSGDVDMDGIIRAKDLSMLLFYYGESGEHAADITGTDGYVNLDDLSTLLGNYGKRLSQLLK